MKKYWDKISERGRLGIFGAGATSILFGVMFCLMAEPGFHLGCFLFPIAVGLIFITVIAVANYEE